SFVRSRSSAPARTISAATFELLDDRGNLVRSHGPAVVVVDGDDRRPAAPAHAFDGTQRHEAVVRRLAGGNAELFCEAFEHLAGADERAGDVRAHLDYVAPDGS